MMNKAVILLSGGLDSLTCLAIAKNEGFACHALSFDYGQRNHVELNSAKRIAQCYQVEHHIVNLEALSNSRDSSLINHMLNVPEYAGETSDTTIPSTYVPARNTIFLSIALGIAEILLAGHIFIGVNAIDYSNYPDCRPDYIDAFQKIANLATKRAIEGNACQIEAPLQHLTKSQIITLGNSLGVDYSLSVTCYNPDNDGRACGKCDSCTFRRKGFEDAKIKDPTIYQDS